MAWVVGVAVALGLGVVTIAALWVWRNQERVVFQPQGPPWPEAPAGARRVDYRAADGQPLFAWVVGDGAAPRVVLAFHGNADLAVRQLPWAAELARRAGVRVMVAEYRGYGGLAGAPTYAASALDARAAWAAARELPGAAPGDVVLFGHSLGSAVAAELAGALPASDAPRALVLQSPFSSARAMARVMAGRPLEALWGAVSRVHFDTEARVRALDAPVWVAHGTRDFIIPPRMGRTVFAAARVKGELLMVDGAGHNDVDLVGGDAYWRWLVAAVTR